MIRKAFIPNLRDEDHVFMHHLHAQVEEAVVLYRGANVQHNASFWQVSKVFYAQALIDSGYDPEKDANVNLGHPTLFTLATMAARDIHPYAPINLFLFSSEIGRFYEVLLEFFQDNRDPGKERVAR